MRLIDLFSFHWGSRAAIQRIARSRGAGWVTVALVISAALARDYDGVDLRARPWELLAPLAVSWFTASVLYFMLVGLFVRTPSDKVGRDALPRSSGQTYAAFVILFWMTAPHAWLYGIPYERFVTEYDATRLNLLTLAVVSVWRIFLITRVASVLLGLRLSVLLPAVLWLADTVLVVFAIAAPKPVIGIMSGVQHSATDQLILNAMLMLIFWGVVAWPVLALITIVTKVRMTQDGRYLESRDAAGPRPSAAVWAAVVLVLLAWTAAAVSVQGEQRLAERVRKAMAAGDFAAAAEVLSSDIAEAFPPHFPTLPDAPFFGVNEPLLRLAQAVEHEPGAEWAANRLQAEVDDYFSRMRFLRGEDLSVLIEVLPELKNGPRYARYLQRELLSIREWLDEPADAEALAQVDRLLALGEASVD